MFKNFLRMDAFTWVQAHNLIEQVYEVSVGDPLLATEIEAFLEDSHQVTEARTKQLVLLSHNLCVVTTCNAEKSKIDSCMAIK